jgi:hypothetical protein
MAIVPQFATAMTDGLGDATFVFPDVPMGQLWCGTTTIPTAGQGAISLVQVGGLTIGVMYGPGSYGPWTADHSRKLSISSTGLAPSTQFTAVWHADDKGHEFSVYPSPITPTVAGTVSGSVIVANFPAVQPVSGTVTAMLQQSAGVSNGQVTMTGVAVQLATHPAVRGVVCAAPAANAHPIWIGNAAVLTTTGLIVDPGHETDLLPVTNSNDLWAIGTAADVLTFLVT